LITVIKCKYWN